MLQINLFRCHRKDRGHFIVRRLLISLNFVRKKKKGATGFAQPGGHLKEGRISGYSVDYWSCPNH